MVNGSGIYGYYKSNFGDVFKCLSMPETGLFGDWIHTLFHVTRYWLGFIPCVKMSWELTGDGFIPESSTIYLVTLNCIAFFVKYFGQGYAKYLSINLELNGQFFKFICTNIYGIISKRPN